MSHDNFRFWTRRTFIEYRGSVAFIATLDSNDNEGIGSAFHVGNGVFVTARHVLEDRTVKEIGFDDDSIICLLNDKAAHSRALRLPSIEITGGPHFHADPKVDLACFTLSIQPTSYIPLGGHLDDWLTQYELVLNRTLVMGYPPIPFSDRPNLFASSGEVNALVDL